MVTRLIEMCSVHALLATKKIFCRYLVDAIASCLEEGKLFQHKHILIGILVGDEVACDGSPKACVQFR